MHHDKRLQKRNVRGVEDKIEFDLFVIQDETVHRVIVPLRIQFKQLRHA